jgi:hypothetical protein
MDEVIFWLFDSFEAHNSAFIDSMILMILSTAFDVSAANVFSFS